MGALGEPAEHKDRSYYQGTLVKPQITKERYEYTDIDELNKGEQ